MMQVPRIAVEETRRKVTAEEALLICAYPDVAKCGQMKLDGSIMLEELEARLPSLAKDQELVFYCA